jgi:hypothetical protein
MTKPTIDFNRVEPHQQAIHDRLVNWDMWVRVRHHSIVQPMWKQYRSNAWQWHPKEFRPTCDILDAQFIEKAVSRLPRDYAMALRCHYVYNPPLAVIRRELATTTPGVYRMVRDARQMLINLVD